MRTEAPAAPAQAASDGRRASWAGRCAAAAVLTTALLLLGATHGAPDALAQGVSRAEAAEIARARAGGGTVLNVSTRGNTHVVRLVNPQGQVVTIKVDAR